MNDNIIITKRCVNCSDEVEHLYAYGTEREQICITCWHESRGWTAYKALNVKFPPDKTKVVRNGRTTRNKKL